MGVFRIVASIKSRFERYPIIECILLLWMPKLCLGFQSILCRGIGARPDFGDSAGFVYLLLAFISA